MSVDQEWIKDWFLRLDRGARYEAVNDLRAAAERQVVDLNRGLGEKLKEFAKAVLDVYAFLDAEEQPADMDVRFQRAKELEQELREMEETLDRLRREFDAYAGLERTISRMER